jgi:hypothetical protein
MQYLKQRPNRNNLVGIKTDTLWVLIILAGFLFFTSLVPLPPNDYWWHLRIGEVVSTEHVIPTTNQYGWTIPSNQPFFYAAWLGEWLLYTLHRSGGLALNIFARTALVGLAFWIVAVEARRRSNSWRIAAFALALASLMSTNNLIVRTQMWAWLPFIGTYTLLSRYVDGQLSKKWLIICPVFMIFWVNVHGSFILGLGLMAIFVIGETVRRIFIPTTGKSWNQISWLACATGLTGLAIMINPRFFGIISYVSNLITNQPSQQLIVEWQSPTPHGLANLVFFGSILLLLVGLTYTQAKLSPTELILIIAFIWLAWEGQRYVAWYGMVVMPIFGKVIAGLPIKTPNLTSQKNWVNLLIAGVLFVPVVLVQPWFVQRMPLPAAYWAQVQNDPEVGPLISPETPIDTVHYLQDNPGGRLFNELGYGSYLIWALPDQQVFVDSRIELYPMEVWEDYIDISKGIRSIEILEQYGVDRVLLDRTLQPELSRVLQSSPGWKLEYPGKYSELWVKNR